MKLLFYPQILTLLFPIVFALVVRGRWKDRGLFMLVGFGVCWGVGFVILMLLAVVEAFSKSAGIGSGSETFFSLPLGFWLGLGLSYLVNSVGVFLALRLLLPKLVPNES
jgi:hypothetical protein